MKKNTFPKLTAKQQSAVSFDRNKPLSWYTEQIKFFLQLISVSCFFPSSEDWVGETREAIKKEKGEKKNGMMRNRLVCALKADQYHCRETEGRGWTQKMQTHNQCISVVMHFSSGSSEQLNQTSSVGLLVRGPTAGSPKRRGTSASISEGDEDGSICVPQEHTDTYRDLREKAARWGESN